MEGIVKNLTVIRTAHSSVRIIPANLTGILKPFSTDYFLYWGSITTPINIHNILWIICREPIGLTTKQVNPYISCIYFLPLFLTLFPPSFNRAFLIRDEDCRVSHFARRKRRAYSVEHSSCKTEAREERFSRVSIWIPLRVTFTASASCATNLCDSRRQSFRNSCIRDRDRN